MSLDGKVVLVTGAARGMGREYVRGFLEKGARVVAADVSWAPTGVSSDDIDFGAELRDNEDALVVQMDITSQAHVDRAYKEAMQRFGTIDVILNNAGLRQRDLYPPHGFTSILETDVSDWQRMFETHVFGTLRVIKRFSEPMLAKGAGSIINVCSGPLETQRGTSREGAYQPAKAAEVIMTVYLATELKPKGIAANVIFPGHTRSTGSDEQESTRQVIRAEEGSAPAQLRRLKPTTVVPVALFLAEQDANGVTGQMFQALKWNEEHGLGGFETWGHEEDVAAWQASQAAGR
jgi:NAD(P)-dependent dehydrogenase (short-subunit alcohol dehydrogenase family)